MRSRMGSRMAGIVMMALGALSLHASDYFVDIANVSGHEAPYTNWSMAATNIQFAVDAASAYDTVWVKPGHYTLPTNYVVAAGTNVVYMNKPLDLRSTEGAEQTIIDGEGLYRCLSFHYDDGTMTNLTEGFTFTGGAATNGAGLHNDVGDYETYYREAIRRKLYSCIISNNHATANGGGFYGGYSRPNLETVISNCVFKNNTANNGGGIYRNFWADTWTYDSLFEDNRAIGGDGGAIFSGGRNPQLIQNCVFRNNRASEGGVYTPAYLQLATFRNCLMVGNYGTEGGVFYGNKKAQVMFENCTIVSNTVSAGSGKGIIEIDSSTTSQRLKMYNCLVYHNVNADLSIAADYNTTYSNNCIAVTNGIADFYTHGNITNAPVFVDAGNTNLRHKIDSPCVNAGVNLDWMEDFIDLDGSPRIDYGVVDIGCYEHTTYGTWITVQ